MTSFCRDCTSWQFEQNPQLQTEDERDGFGLCMRIANMMTNPTRAIARLDDEFANFQCRGEYGCNLFEGG
jgi:hypothetical protein